MGGVAGGRFEDDARAVVQDLVVAVVQQGDVALRPPGRRDGRGELALLVQEVLETLAHATRFDDEDLHVAPFVEQRAALVGDEGHPALHGVEDLPLRQTVEDLTPPGVGLGQRTAALALDLARYPLARRRHHGLVEVGARALGGDVEDGESFDLVAEEVESQRLQGLGRPDVDDAAAHRELGAVLDEVLAAIAAAHQSRKELVAVELHAASHDQRCARTARREDLSDGPCGGDGRV